MAQWANFLPGFDATFHDLSNMKIDIKDDSTNATVISPPATGWVKMVFGLCLECMRSL